MVRCLHPKYPRRIRSFVFLLLYEGYCSCRQATYSVSEFLSHTDIVQGISQPVRPPDPFHLSPYPCSSQAAVALPCHYSQRASDNDIEETRGQQGRLPINNASYPVIFNKDIWSVHIPVPKS